VSGRAGGPVVVGLCAAMEHARFGVWEDEAVLLPRSYVRAVQEAGGLALLLAPDPAVTTDPDLLLDRIDALILAGGSDVDPAAYGADPDPSTTPPNTDRDAFELALAGRAMERDLPLLGICRGMQVMNVARGGTLLQHLPDTLGHEDHRRTPGSFDDADHDVRLREGSLAARVAGETRHGTKSHHHQGVDAVGAGLEITGWAAGDDLPEAIEDPARRFALGVQWHPEADPVSPLIGALVHEARDRLAAGATR
jgi:putative glutamine amidotransferase